MRCLSTPAGQQCASFSRSSTTARNKECSQGARSWQLVHEVICTKLSKLGGTVLLRALYLACHKEILNIVYQCVQFLLKNTWETELRQFLDHGGKWRDEFAVSLLKTGAESGSHVLKTTVFLTSLLEKMAYSMICNSFHIFHCEIIRE